MRKGWRGLWWGLPLFLSWALAFDTGQADADMKALLANGPRVAGTPPASQAAGYLAAELRKAGYTVEFMPFTYTRTRDLGSSLTVGSANLQANAIAGSPARRLEEALRSQGKRLVFAMNAGMFDPARAPVGLYVENGRQLRPLVLSDGPGNFHLKPNGVFYSTNKRVGVLESGQYARQKPATVLATQSGPMLVIGGRIHPRFLPESRSFKIRNGVGVSDPSRAVFVVSSQPVNFYTFASFFRDALGCKDALYLDGSISSLYSPDVGRADGLFPLGPIIGVVR